MPETTKLRSGTQSRKYPPLPETPACWEWPIPAQPQPNDPRLLKEWQADRCGICAVTPADCVELFRDHDHLTMNVRGYLCPRCNTSEGQHWAVGGVFEHWRRRPAAAVLNIVEHYRRPRHPDEDLAEKTLGEAFGALRAHADPDEWRRYNQIFPGPPPDLPEWTPLVEALHRVGLTGREWFKTRDDREQFARTPTAHLPTEADPPRNACGGLGLSWIEPRPNTARRPCPDCYLIDPMRMTALVGDGYGPDSDYDRELIRAANRWRLRPSSAASDHEILG